MSPIAGNSAIDPVELAAAMIRCPSVTPADEGALDVLQAALEGLGFTCHRLPFSEPGEDDVDNLYARIGDGGPNFCFAGHTDVVPVGDEAAWSVGPFAARIVDDTLYGRGAADMKGAVACFAAAAGRLLAARGTEFGGSISLLITGDEEGPGVNGTKKVLDWLRDRREKLDVCLVGEPTNPEQLGQMVKIGRRGTLTGTLTVRGAQGHVAYPQLADNPLPRLVATLAVLDGRELDQGTTNFQPSNLEITTVDVGNPASNIIPASASATFNIRFNDMHTGASLTAWLTGVCDTHAGDHDLHIRIGGEAFLTPPGPLSDIISDAVELVLGSRPELSTTGGTSDARFIKDLCPVAEFGLVGQTMHKVDERVLLADLAALSDVYTAVLDAYFPH
ncbi:MAG: succinyl-diaminopimelate desuccinylase [Pseudomonadota bacterium]|nr:succinyl-diaminopimelate desuccinylase [Pseudomonadota bacterium]